MSTLQITKNTEITPNYDFFWESRKCENILMIYVLNYILLFCVVINEVCTSERSLGVIISRRIFCTRLHNACSKSGMSGVGCPFGTSFSLLDIRNVKLNLRILKKKLTFKKHRLRMD
jgi:hypothetical protein